MSTVEVTRQGPRPAIRLRPAPRHEPPFDDERDPETWPNPHQLALDWAHLIAAPPPPPEAPPPPVKRTIVSGVSSDAKLAVRRFVKLCVEVLNGNRPAAHLRPLTQPREVLTVLAEGRAAAQRVAQARRTPTRPRPRRPSPVVVLRLQLCEPRPGAVEAALILMTADRTFALALRLELHNDL
ncbi:Rv3235 family protein [Actinoplanes friuliensis]|uniref:Rv3235 family protein n=1 Tax=Actinoplanes friuliensis TaxID=196914 RepID=UPI0004287E76|nr:Rv3235 family protein [Actinoplanes friuliensis]